MEFIPYKNETAYDSADYNSELKAAKSVKIKQLGRAAILSKNASF